MGTRDFSSQFLEIINRVDTKINFNLTGPDGEMINVMQAITDGAKGINGAEKVTNWELFQLYSNPDALQRTTFYFNGRVVLAPF